MKGSEYFLNALYTYTHRIYPLLSFSDPHTCTPMHLAYNTGNVLQKRTVPKTQEKSYISAPNL